MGRKPKKRKRKTTSKGPIKITGASIVGVAIGILIMGMGLYSAFWKDEMGGLYVVALGTAFLGAVLWGMWRSR